MAKADIKRDVHNLIHELVSYIHKNEPDIEKSILIFLPTYYSLEQQWFLLKPFSSDFKVHILHSSVDTNQALMAMKISKSRRKVHFGFLCFCFSVDRVVGQSVLFSWVLQIQLVLVLKYTSMSPMNY